MTAACDLFKRRATLRHMSGSQRDAGLVRTLGPWSLAASTISVIVGAGIFAVPGALAAYMGAYAPLAFLVGGMVIGAIALCFAEGGSRIPTSGGAYGYIEVAFGPLWGFIAGMLLWIGDVLACGGVAAALADTMVTVLPPQFRIFGHAAVIVCVIGVIALVNMRSVSGGARLINVITVLKLLPLLTLVVAGSWAIRIGNFAAPVHASAHGLGRGLILTLFALTGMEVSLNASGEVKEPSRNIPRALAIAIGSAVVLFIAIQVVAQGILGASLSSAAAPLVDAMAHISPALRAPMLAGVAVVLLGWLSSDLLSSPRVLFAFGRDGMLPAILGRIDERRHTPRIAIGCYAAIALILALTGTFAELAVLSMLATAALYIGACAAAWWLARQRIAEAGVPLGFRWLAVAAIVGIGGMTALIALASLREILGVVAVIAGSAAIYVCQTRLWPLRKATETPIT